MATLTQDSTGAFTDPNGQNLAGLNSTSSTSGTPTNWDRANLGLMYILTQGQQANTDTPTSGQTALQEQSQELTNQQLNAGNPESSSNPDASVFAGMGGNAYEGESAVEAGYQPGILGINSQIENSINQNTAFQGNVSAAEGIVQNMKNVVSPGQSIVDNSGNVIYQGHSYTPTANPTTGQIDGFDQTTGQWLSAVKSQNQSDTNYNASGASSGIVGGVNVASYNGNVNPDYATDVNRSYQDLEKANPAPTAAGFDSYIQNNAGQGNSPVTGQMIMNAATTYGIDPNLLAAVLNNESDFGTAGLGAKTNNPGNVGNTGTAQQSYNSWQAGVNAAAKTLAQYQVSPSGNNTPGTAGVSNVGNEFSPVDAAKVQQLPASMQGYVQGGLFGTAYIDASRVPQAFQDITQAQAAKAGIPYLSNAADVAAAQSLTQAQQNMNLMKTTAAQVLGSGVTGALKDIGATALNDVTFGNALPEFNKFNSYATAAVNELKALAGSGGGFRITQAEIDTAQANLPVSTDTLKNAQVKMNVLQGLIDTTVSKIFPDAQIPITLPNGTAGTIPAKNYSAAVALGATSS